MARYNDPYKIEPLSEERFIPKLRKRSESNVEQNEEETAQSRIKVFICANAKVSCAVNQRFNSVVREICTLRCGGVELQFVQLLLPSSGRGSTARLLYLEGFLKLYK
jgi:hypothetical protein